MFGKLAKSVLITTGAFWMFPLAFESGKFAVVIAVAAALLVWFLWAVWRISVLCRARAFRADAEPWQHEAFGFAAGILIATPALVLFFGNVLVARLPDERTIADAPTPGFELALDMYHTDTGSYPSKDGGLAELIDNPGVARWAGPYINPESRRYIDWFDYSVGADGKPVLIARPRNRRKSLP